MIKLATDAGFRLKAKSEINANPKDTKDYEKGVWTLPPTFELGDKDREKYAAIGESDRMTLKFVKPGGPTRSSIRARTPRTAEPQAASLSPARGREQADRSDGRARTTGSRGMSRSSPAPSAAPC